MSYERNTSETASGTTSSSKRENSSASSEPTAHESQQAAPHSDLPRTHDQRPGHAKHPESEAAFLLRQAAEAKAAIAQTAKDMGANLGHAVDVRLWTKDHPWSMLAAAVVGGFAAAAALVPSEEQQALNKLRKIEEALHLHMAGEKADKADKAKTTAEPDGKA